jgi:hypothetical protein
MGTEEGLLSHAGTTELLTLISWRNYREHLMITGGLLTFVSYGSKRLLEINHEIRRFE